MDNGTGGNGGSNGILMGNEIMDSPSVTPQASAPQQATVQQQQGATQMPYTAQSAAQSVAQPQYRAQPAAQQTAQAQYGAQRQAAAPQQTAAQYGGQTVANPQMAAQTAASQQSTVQAQYGAQQTTQQSATQSQYRAQQTAAAQQSVAQSQYGAQRQSAAIPQPQYGAQATASGVTQTSAAQAQYGAQQSTAQTAATGQSTAQAQYGAAIAQAAAPQPEAQNGIIMDSEPTQTGLSDMDSFNNAPSFDAMDGFDVTKGPEVLGANTGSTSTSWASGDTDSGAFRGSAAGRYPDASSAVIHESVSSNIFLGLVGAVIGALLGSVIWIIIYQLGYLAGIAGAAIIGFSLVGYRFMGKSLDLKGVIVCAVLSIVTIWFAHRVSFAIMYMNTMNEVLESNMDFITAYKGLSKFMEISDMASEALGTGNSVTTAYYRDLFVGYVLSVVTGFSIVKGMLSR